MLNFKETLEYLCERASESNFDAGNKKEQKKVVYNNFKVTIIFMPVQCGHEGLLVTALAIFFLRAVQTVILEVSEAPVANQIRRHGLALKLIFCHIA